MFVLYQTEGTGIISKRKSWFDKEGMTCLKNPRGLCYDSHRGVCQWPFMALIYCHFELHCNQNHYGQVAETLLLQPRLEENFLFLWATLKLNFRSLSK